MNAALVLVRDDGKMTEVPLKKAAQSIGRQTDCAIRIPSGSISRHHCEVTVGDDGITIRDLGSSNGTYVNRKRVTQLALSAGDLISIGEFVFVVQVNGKPADIDPEEAYDDGLVIPAAMAKATGTSGGAGDSSHAPKAQAPAKPAPTAPKSQAPAKPAAPAPKPAQDDLHDSSVSDFDFLDEDDLKGQPKL